MATRLSTAIFVATFGPWGCTASGPTIQAPAPQDRAGAVACTPDQPDCAGFTVAMLDQLRTRMQTCYRGADDMPEPESKWAQVRAELHPDGSLAAPARIIEHSGGRYGEIVAQRAIDAVTECAPYDFLPAALYDGPNGWNTLTLNFVNNGAQ